MLCGGGREESLLLYDRQSVQSWLMLPFSKDLYQEMMSFWEEKLGTDLPQGAGALRAWRERRVPERPLLF